MALPRLRAACLIAATALLGGCASQGTFPSLAPRAVEMEMAGPDQPLPPCAVGAGVAAAPEKPVPAPVADDPALRSRIGELVATARTGDTAFTATLDDLGSAIAGAGAAGSESWIAAQLALSRSEAARAPTATALADLTALALSKAAGPVSEADRQVLGSAIAEVETMSARQIAEIDRAKASISPA